MIVRNSNLLLVLLVEIARLRADLRQADQLSIQMEQERDWYKGQAELLRVAQKRTDKA